MQFGRQVRATVLTAAAVAALGGAPPAAADPPPAQAFADLNAWRAELGEAPVSAVSSDHPTDAAWDSGCQQHNRYQALNGWAMTHEQTQGNPGSTDEGARAGRNSVLAQHGSLPDPVADSRMMPRAEWEVAVYHRMALIEPRLNRIGYDAETFPLTVERPFHTTFVCLWAQTGQNEQPSAFDNTRTTPALTLYPSPAHGAANVPTRFGARETPNPADEAGVPADQLGWLLSVSANGPWADQAFASAHSVSATLAPDAAPADEVPIAISQCGADGCFRAGGSLYGPYMGGGFGIFPKEPLEPDTVYRVTATGVVTDYLAGAHYPFERFTWCFSTGAYKASATCAAAAGGTDTDPPAEDNPPSLLPTVEEPPPPPPAPDPPPPPKVPSATVKQKSAVVRGRRVAIRLACGPELPCRGILKLQNLRLPQTTSRPVRGKRVSYGQRRFRIRAGSRATLHVRLTRAALKRLRAARRSRRANRRTIRAWANVELRSDPRRQVSKRLTLAAGKSRPRG